MKLRLGVQVKGGVMAAYIDPETRESVKVKRLYFEKPVEVDDYDALHLIMQNKGVVLKESDWQAKFGESGEKINPDNIDKESAVQHVLSLKKKGLMGLYSNAEMKELAQKVFGVKIPTTVKRKEDLAAALIDIANAIADEFKQGEIQPKPQGEETTQEGGDWQEPQTEELEKEEPEK